MKSFSVLLPFVFLLLLSGCSQKIKVQALQPAEIDRAASTKKIAISPFKKDRIGLSSKIESAIANKQVDGKHYFTTISRSDIDKILQEQRLQNSGLLDESTSVQVGKLLGVQALISGIVTTAAASDTAYYATRTKCTDKKCEESYEYKVRCTKRVITLAAQIKMIDIEKGDIIYADTLSDSKTWSHCSDRKSTLPSKAQGLDQIANSLSTYFTHKLAPHYITYSVELLDDPEIDYTDKQEEILEHALTYIEHKRYDKAEQLLSRLLESTNDRCYVSAYNLGIVKEVQGDLQSAKQLFSLADTLTIEPVQPLNTALLRIDRSITANEQASMQIAQ